MPLRRSSNAGRQREAAGLPRRRGFAPRRRREEPGATPGGGLRHDLSALVGDAAPASIQRMPEERPADPRPSSRGKPLPSRLRSQMERSMGTDFSGVKIHEGPHASSLGAIAYTRGESLHFAPGRYRPESRDGQRLLAHELTHVVQQRAGRVASPKGPGAPINDHPTLEAEADRMAERAVSPTVSSTVSTPAGAHTLGCGCSGCAGVASASSMPAPASGGAQGGGPGGGRSGR